MKKLTAITLFYIAISSPIYAATFTVNDDRDSAEGIAADCTDGKPGKRCSIRDALAAADLTAELDTIVFDINKTIFIQSPLTAKHPVQIDGSAEKTSIRVSQAYKIEMLADRFEPYEMVPVLLPEYASINGPSRPMMKLSGHGSEVTNLKLDGSITPHGKDIGIARIDYDSNFATDFFLYTIAAPIDHEVNGESSNTSRQHVGERWPIAGGILVSFADNPGGQLRVTNSDFSNHNSDALHVEYFGIAEVIGNQMSDGTVDQSNGSGSGFFAFFGANLLAADNNISGFREGISLNSVVGMQVIGNTTSQNRKGIFLEQTDNRNGENKIANNVVSLNSESGITVASALAVLVENNQISQNAPFGMDIKSAGYIGVTNNEVFNNGIDPVFHGGIRLTEGSSANYVAGNTIAGNSGFGIVVDEASANTITYNDAHNNGGAGLVLLNDSQHNRLLNNRSVANGVGLFVLSLSGVLPSYNEITANFLRDNAVFDAIDTDPLCNNQWLNNDYVTENSTSANCIQ